MAARSDDEERPYHHGDLRRAVLAVAVEAIAEYGPDRLRLRDVARRAGVAHTSVAYHVGDRAGLFAAVAAEGYRLLVAELTAARVDGGGFLELGVAYMRFSVRHPAHAEVMFRPGLYDRDAPEVAAARAEARAHLYGGATELSDRPDDDLAVAVAGWALVHGLADLWRSGNLPPGLPTDPEELTRRIAVHLGP